MNRHQPRAKIAPLLRKFHENHEKSFTRQAQACRDMIILWDTSSPEVQIRFGSMVLKDEHFIEQLIGFFELDSNSFSHWKQAQFLASVLLKCIINKCDHNKKVLKQAVDKFEKNGKLIKQLLEFITRMLARDIKDSCKIITKTLTGCIIVLCIVCIESSMCLCDMIRHNGLEILQKFLHLRYDMDSMPHLDLNVDLEEDYSDRQALVLASTTSYLCAAINLVCMERSGSISEIDKLSRYFHITTVLCMCGGVVRVVRDVLWLNIFVNLFFLYLFLFVKF